MAISNPALLGTASNTAASATIVSGTLSPTANALLIAAACLGASSSTDFTQSIADTFIGTGAWTQYTISASDATANRFFRTSVFVAQAGAVPLTGAITVTASANQSRKTLSVYEVTGFNTSTPVAQSITGENEATPLTLIFGGSPVATSLIFAAIGAVAETSGITPGTNFTELDEVDSTGSNNIVLETQYDNGSGTTTADWSALVNRQHVGVAIEISVAGGGGSSIKTVNGLAIASVKVVNGLAIASIKSINGLQ